VEAVTNALDPLCLLAIASGQPLSTVWLHTLRSVQGFKAALKYYICREIQIWMYRTFGALAIYIIKFHARDRVVYAALKRSDFA
jgi:hypothetical protein